MLLTVALAFGDNVKLAISEFKLVLSGASTAIVFVASLIAPTTAGLANEYEEMDLALPTVMHVPATAIDTAVPV